MIWPWAMVSDAWLGKLSVFNRLFKRGGMIVAIIHKVF